MSVVPQHGILRKHYEEAVEDNEHKPSIFWHAWLQRTFYEVDEFSVIEESSSDGPGSRVEMAVKRYDSANHHFMPVLLVVCEQPPTGSVREVEDQALEAALHCISIDNLLRIYAITSIGVSFRTWLMNKKSTSLIPLHGTAGMGSSQEYIDADSDHAYELTKVVELVKSDLLNGDLQSR